MFFICTLATLTIAMACSSGDSKKKETDYDAMAKDLCTCLKPMFDFQQDLLNMVIEGKDEEVMGMRDRAMQIEAEGETCVRALEAKYGIIEGEEHEAKATEALRKACPEIVALMEGGLPDPSLLNDVPIEELGKRTGKNGSGRRRRTVNEWIRFAVYRFRQ